MHLVGRFDRVRELGPGGWGNPYVLDRRPYAQGAPVLRPFADRGEWWRSPEGVWVPTLSGGAYSGRTQVPNVVASYGGAIGTQNTVALDSAYTFNTAGDGMGVRITWGRDLGALQYVYYYITSAAAGTQANINDIDAEFRNSQGGLRPNTTSPTLHDSGSDDPNGEATWIGWHRITWDTGFTPLVDTEYWVIIADADGGGVNYATLGEGWSDLTLIHPAGYTWHRVADSANGFQSGGLTSRAALPSLVLGCASGVLGCSIGTVTTSSNTTNRRGWYLDGFTERLKIFGVSPSVTTLIAGAEYYSDPTDTPGSPTVSSTTFLYGGASSNKTGVMFSTPIEVPKATAVRFVVSISSNDTAVRKWSIGTGNGYATDAILRKARIGGAGWYWAEANGTTDWANDDPDSQPGMALLVDDQVAEPTDAEIATAIWAYGNRTLSA